MALQSSGQISLDDIHQELGATSGTQVALNDSDVRGLINKTSGSQMSISEWYGASNAQTFQFASAGHASTPSKYYTSYDGTASSPTANFYAGYPSDLMVAGVNGFMYTTGGTSYAPPQGSMSNRTFITGQLFTGIYHASNPGGSSITFGSLNNPASTSGSNSGWSTITFSAYGTSLPMGVATTKTWSTTLSRTDMQYTYDTNQTISGGYYTQYARGFNNRWRWYRSPYGSSTPYSGDFPSDVFTAARSSANNGAGVTISFT
jgi:hypothetical protein